MQSLLRARSTLLARLCAVALLGALSFGQGMAADSVASRPPASVVERAPPVQEAPSPALPHVEWPNNGIAQRRLEGGINYNMFVENDNGTWRAWVQSDVSALAKRNSGKAKALDFFSGEQRMVKASVEEYTQEQEPGFWDPKRREVHIPHRDWRLQFIRDGYVEGLKRSPLLDLDAERCPHSFSGLQSESGSNAQRQPVWSRIPLIHDKTFGSLCKEGEYSSSIYTTLDLNDGTFLVTMQCWIFRLRKSDLSPVGEAPALRIVDEAALKAAIDKAKGQHIESGTAYIDQALGLHIDEAYACKRSASR
ncbi:MAG: hypothetical protein JSS56_24740 [Proteobacteria bacterium]|nr:hypothetical protein [Pseudomonadota bacterium]